MSRAGDPVTVIEAAYRWEPDLASWMAGIVDALAPYDVGGGIVAYGVTAQQHTAVGPFAASARASPRVAESLHQLTEAFPAWLGRLVYAPTEHVGNAAHRLARLHREHAHAPLEQARPQLPGTWALVAGDPDQLSLAMMFPCKGHQQVDPDDIFPHRGRRHLGHVGAHISSALRLRGLLAPTDAGANPPAAPTGDDPSTEAVLDPDGTILHATGPARSTGARKSLVRAVLRSERARGRMRRADPDEAVQEWAALVEGRWTIVEAIDHGGRRTLLARKNPLTRPDPIAPTPEERAVVWLAACGHSYKYIAYELGLSIGAVSNRLRSAMRKLGVASRSELLARLGIPS